MKNTFRRMGLAGLVLATVLFPNVGCGPSDRNNLLRDITQKNPAIENANKNSDVTASDEKIKTRSALADAYTEDYGPTTTSSLDAYECNLGKFALQGEELDGLEYIGEACGANIDNIVPEEGRKFWWGSEITAAAYKVNFLPDATLLLYTASLPTNSPISEEELKRGYMHPSFQTNREDIRMSSLTQEGKYYISREVYIMVLENDLSTNEFISEETSILGTAILKNMQDKYSKRLSLEIRKPIY